MRNITLFILGLGSLLISAGPIGAGPELIHQESFTTADGLSLHYEEAGQGPLMVFLTGWSFPASVWREQVTRFSVDHRAIALDPRSHGGSDDSVSGQHPLDMAGDLDTLLNRLGGRDVVLVGWSLGGSVAMAYLRKHDHTRIKALVLIDSATGSSSSPALLQRRADFIERLRRDREATLHNLVVSMFRKPQSETLIDNLTTACMRMPIEHSINLLLGEHDVESWNPKDRDLQLPILYLASPGYAEAGRWMKKRSPTTRLEVYQRSGHGFFLEEPDLFEKSVRRFLSSIPKDPGGKP